ncbi:helix-turn-helix domain-containing protein [Chryseobacterium taichungense]|uniref:helix-turn-helix domain-containing protein n=1 Tax=Chryseobacterium taichungense TaxID=295069 RepID=UPI0028AA9826|nr:helix-turn-helix domain-containing protein [Chryseobacterium taichungense]
MKKNTSQPDFKRIYTDILEKKFPEKKKLCEKILSKKTFSELDVIAINNIIFAPVSKDIIKSNQQHRSYSKSTIIKILEFQKQHGLNNTKLALHYKLSRNTVSRWKKLFIV